MFKVDVRLHRHPDLLLRFAEALVERYAALGAHGPASICSTPRSPAV